MMQKDVEDEIRRYFWSKRLGRDRYVIVPVGTHGKLHVATSTSHQSTCQILSPVKPSNFCLGDAGFG
jgi:hypothetical protein